MLSPNATNDVWLIFGGKVTVTLKEHWVVTLLVSVATHATGVVPTLKTVPLAGVQTI